MGSVAGNKTLWNHDDFGFKVAGNFIPLEWYGAASGESRRYWGKQAGVNQSQSAGAKAENKLSSLFPYLYHQKPSKTNHTVNPCHFERN